MRMRLKGVVSYQSGGKIYFYLRRKGLPNVRLDGLPGTAQFMASYQAAAEAAAPQRESFEAGTFGRLITDFYRSAGFANLKPNSKRIYRLILDGLSQKHGTRPARTMPRTFVVKLIEGVGSTRPALANLMIAVMSRLMGYAVKSGIRSDNPMMGFERYKGGTHHTWTDAELAAFEARWPLGMRERLAYALLLFTDQRVGDVSRMRQSDISEGAIHVVQEKRGAELWLPIHPELQAAMAACPANGLTLIGHRDGRPMRSAALSGFVMRAAGKAGLPARCKTHGLRKALMRRLAQGGATTKELQSISGHATLVEVERYTKAADQRELAKSAMNKIAPKKV